MTHMYESHHRSYYKQMSQDKHIHESHNRSGGSFVEAVTIGRGQAQREHKLRARHMNQLNQFQLVDLSQVYTHTHTHTHTHTEIIAVIPYESNDSFITDTLNSYGT